MAHRFASVAVVALTAVLLYHADSGAFRAASTGIELLGGSALPVDQLRQRQYAHLRDELARQVRPGTRMVIGLPPNSLWYQRLAECAAIDRIDLVDQRAEAEVSATVARDSMSPGGVRLVIRRAS